MNTESNSLPSHLWGGIKIAVKGFSQKSKLADGIVTREVDEFTFNSLSRGETGVRHFFCNLHTDIYDRARDFKRPEKPQIQTLVPAA